MEAPQPLLAEKSPVAVTLLIVRDASPELLRVMLWRTLVVPTCWSAKVRVVGETVA